MPSVDFWMFVCDGCRHERCSLLQMHSSRHIKCFFFFKKRKAVMHHPCLKLKRFSATDVFICDLEVVEVY